MLCIYLCIFFVGLFLNWFLSIFVLKGIFYLIVFIFITFSLHLFNINSLVLVFLAVFIAVRAVCYVFTQSFFTAVMTFFSFYHMPFNNLL